MDHFQFLGDVLHCENIPLAELASDYGTPLYVYSSKTLNRHCEKLKEAFADYPTKLCYAVKANSNTHILRRIFSNGFGGDLVSKGELLRSLKAGVNAQEVVFSGVGKKGDEIQLALKEKILCFNVESAFELKALADCAKELNCTAPICLRLNPNIDAKTNPKITTGLYDTKFGIPEAELKSILSYVKSREQDLKLIGVACHIGSQMTDLAPLTAAAKRMADVAKDLMAHGFSLSIINMGGGLGIRYDAEEPPSLAMYAKTLIEQVRETGLSLIIEPGRVLVGNAGILLAEVIGVKGGTNGMKRFTILDAAMNDLLRPTLYKAYHDIVPVVSSSREASLTQFVGPICESGDILGEDRTLPTLNIGDLVAIKSCGAYAATMASNYNSRLRAPEVLVENERALLIRRRETYEDLLRLEE